MQLLELIVAEILDRGEFVLCALHCQNEFGQLELDRQDVAVLRVLDQENHQERDDRGRRVDHELPCVAVMKERAGRRPHDHKGDGHHKGGGSTGHRGKVAREFRKPLAAHHDLR